MYRGNRDRPRNVFIQKGAGESPGHEERGILEAVVEANYFHKDLRFRVDVRIHTRTKEHEIVSVYTPSGKMAYQQYLQAYEKARSQIPNSLSEPQHI